MTVVNLHTTKSTRGTLFGNDVHEEILWIDYVHDLCDLPRHVVMKMLHKHFSTAAEGEVVVCADQDMGPRHYKVDKRGDFIRIRNLSSREC